MARRRHYEKIDINVEPFLSIMAIVMKLISLIMVVIVMRIAVNPHAKKIVSLLQYEGRGNVDNPKMPSYVDCQPDGIVLYPGAARVSWEQLQRPGNAVELLFESVQKKSADEYIVVMVRPGCLRYYRAIRNMLAKRPIDVGYDVVDAEFNVNWDEATKALQISED